MGPGTIKFLWRVFRSYRWYILALLLLGLVAPILEGIGINAAIPLLSFLINGGQPTDIISRTIAAVFHFVHLPFTFRYLLVFIMGLFVVRAISVVAFGYIRGRISADYLSTESELMLKNTFAASWGFLLRQKIGNIQNFLSRDIQRTGDLLNAVGQAIQSVTGFLMYLLVALNIAPLMTCVTVAGGALLFVGVRPLIRHTQESGAAMSETDKQITQFLSEHISGMKSVKAAAAEAPAFERSKKLFASMRALYIKMAFTRSLSSSLFQPTAMVFVIVLFAITYKTATFNLLTFAATLYLIQKIFTYIESGQVSLHGINELVPYARQIEEFKDALAGARETASQGTEPFVFANELRFEHVALSYNKGEPVLRDVTFVIKKGQTVGLIGPSGAGKTSIADLLLRLFMPTGGAIMVDDTKLSDIALEDWRRHLGYVSQDVFLLNDTVEENIRFYGEDISKDDIVAAAKQANIYDFIQTLPEKFDTTVGDRGVLLSGGQRQRVALARALARKPTLLILDEATSALDSESERLIHQSIKALYGQVTVLIIAHRLSTVTDADMILTLERGAIVEAGSPQELSADTNSYFYRMQHSV
jgi:ABC-type multidrug transport system fused ATPase/permease subunit